MPLMGSLVDWTMLRKEFVNLWAWGYINRVLGEKNQKAKKKKTEEKIKECCIILMSPNVGQL